MRSRWLHSSLFLLLLASAAAAEPALVTVSGRVEIGHGTPPAWRVARQGDAVAPGDSLRTGTGARAELALGDGRVVRVYEQSVLRVGTSVTPTGVARTVDLDEGRSLFDVMKQAVADEFEVHTPEIIVSVKGTRFLVAAVPGPDYTSVFRGAVELAEAGFDDVAVREGFTGVRGELLLSNFGDPWGSWEAGALAPLPLFETGRGAELKGAVEAVRADASLSRVERPAKLDAALSLDRSAEGSGGSSGPGSGPGAGPGAGPDPGSSGSGPSGGSPGPDDLGQFPFTFDVQKSGGPNHVTVGFAGQSVTLDQDDVEAIVDGDTGPLGVLNDVVNDLGIDPQDLGDYLDDLI